MQGDKIARAAAALSGAIRLPFTCTSRMYGAALPAERGLRQLSGCRKWESIVQWAEQLNGNYFCFWRN